MMSRIEVSSPPGVSICRTRSSTASRSARAIPRWIKSALAGPMGPTISITLTAGADTAAPVTVSHRSAIIGTVRSKATSLMDSLPQQSLHAGFEVSVSQGMLLSSPRPLPVQAAAEQFNPGQCVTRELSCLVGRDDVSVQLDPRLEALAEETADHVENDAPQPMDGNLVHLVERCVHRTRDQALDDEASSDQAAHQAAHR